MLSVDDLDTTDGLTAFVSAAAAKPACDEAMVYLRACETEGMTLREMLLDVMVRNQGDVGRSWLLWIRLDMASEIAPEIAEIVSRELTSGDADPAVTARFLLTGPCSAGLGAAEREYLQALRSR